MLRGKQIKLKTQYKNIKKNKEQRSIQNKIVSIQIARPSEKMQQNYIKKEWPEAWEKTESLETNEVK